MKSKCKHKWVNMEDGSFDQICVRCRKFQMQAVMMPSSLDAAGTSTLPALRETIEVPFYNGSEHKRVTVYKDDIMKQMRKELGIRSPSEYYFNSANRSSK